MDRVVRPETLRALGGDTPLFNSGLLNEGVDGPRGFRRPSSANADVFSALRESSPIVIGLQD